MPVLTEFDLESAADRLNQSDKGRVALTDLLNFLDNEGISLDRGNQEAVLTLLRGAFGDYTGTARDIMRDRLERRRQG